MQALLPVGVIGLMFAAIFASQMATLSAQMVNSSALASRNIYKAIFRPQASDGEVLIFGRISGIVLVTLGVLLAFQLERVATALTMLLGFQSIMGVIVWAGVLWRRANPLGAWSSFIVMLILWLLLGPVGMIVNRTHALPHWIGIYGSEKYISQLMIWALPGGVLALIVGSFISPPPPRKQVDDFFLLLKTPVGQEQKLIDAGVPIIYIGNTEANALETTHPRLVHWGGFALAALICAGILGLLKLLSVIGS
jgi:SSS family solute:Na+ symporter